jgi:glycosyltransferase involved in cell wall biosynthesis
LNQKNTHISICIPAFERTEFLKRLLDSIVIQTFRNFEVIISDDSSSNLNEVLVKNYPSIDIKYIKNESALGSPKNWNNAVSNASHEWIKIMIISTTKVL